MPADPTTGPHVLTFNLEDYFQVAAFNRYVQSGTWDRFESRLVHHTRRTLDLLDQHQTKATFFVLGWVAEYHPQLVREVSDRGHEIASRGYLHHNIRALTPTEFRDDVAKAKAILENAGGRRVIGYRAADGWFRPKDLWALDVLADEGYLYDSSVAPFGRGFAREPFRRLAHTHTTPHGVIWELPITSVRTLGLTLPIGGGNWVRQLPTGFMQRAARQAATQGPLVMYFQTWELDDAQPRVSTAGPFTRLRHYRNLDCMEERVAEYLKRFTFVPAADWLGVPRPVVVPTPTMIETPAPGMGATDFSIDVRNRQPVTIVIPLYNEEESLGYLGNTLSRVRNAFSSKYDIRFILVNDGSRDGTGAKAKATFIGVNDVTLLEYEVNRGVAAAIATGIRAATTEIVCSMDADCTYDPLELLNMIPKLGEGVDLVTASPYHPQGTVRNVPGWRLFLSKGASMLYRRVMRNKLYTYTSCFRVYRRSAVQDIRIRSGNFLGVVELLGQLDARGQTIIEHPATLNVRVLGRSKMKTLRTIAGHLRLMARLAAGRPRRRRRSHNSPERNHALQLLMETAATSTCHAGLETKPAEQPSGA